MHLNAKLEKLFPQKKIVAFYIGHRNVIPDEWMVALGEKLRERGYATIGLLNDETTGFMDLNGLGQVFTITKDDIKNLDNICCFIVTDFEQDVIYPQK